MLDLQREPLLFCVGLGPGTWILDPFYPNLGDLQFWPTKELNGQASTPFPMLAPSAGSTQGLYLRGPQVSNKRIM